MSRKEIKQHALDIVAGRNTVAAPQPEGGVSGMTWLGIALWATVFVAGSGLAAYVFLFSAS